MDIITRSNRYTIFRKLNQWIEIFGDQRIPLTQFIIFAGSRKPTMPTKIQTRDFLYSYNLVFLREVDGLQFLDSDKPEEVLLGLLCKFPEGMNAPDVIQRIIHTLIEMESGDPELLEKHLFYLKVISQPRNLQEQVYQQLKKMSAHYSIFKDPAYQQGKSDGFSEAKEETRREIVERMLLKKRYPDEEIAELTDAPIADVQEIKEDLLNEGKLF